MQLIGSCFFFQAEDGIRDLVRSRGLGDVYKRQGITKKMNLFFIQLFQEVEFDKQELIYEKLVRHETVSYTHLTLPTSDLV